MEGYRKLAVVGIAIIVIGSMAVLNVPSDMFNEAVQYIMGIVGAFVTGNLIERKLNNTAAANAVPSKEEVK